MNERVESVGANEPKEHSALKDHLSLLEATSDEIYKMEHDPTKVVRTQDVEEVLTESYGRGKIRPVETDEVRRHHATEAVLVASRLLDELKEKYEIPLPNPRLFIGKRPDGKTAVYTVEDFIDGKPITECRPTEKEGARFVSELNHVYAELARYLADKQRSGADYLSDIFDKRQFMYGSSPTDAENHVYLVDTEILFERGNAQIRTPGGPRLLIFPYLYGLADAMREIENTLGIRLAEARQVIRDFLDGLPEKDRSENAARIKKIDILLQR